MPRIPEETINEVRAKADIVDIIARYVTLTKRGKNYWGLSPFRDDRNPSLSVSPDKQIYMDFTTREGGNVFKFIQQIEELSFVEAVIKVASLIGMDLSEYESSQQIPVDESKQILYEIMEETQKYTEYQLYTQVGLPALNTLKERQYDQELLKQFGVGVALDNNQMSTYLTAKGYAMEDLLACDLVRLTDYGYKDVFYRRIMFPIRDAYGRVIAFSARALEKDNEVKYINTSETPLYLKGNTVYNYSRAKDEARKAGFLLVSEGVTDAIAFTKAGYPNVVSLLGVACTEAQIRLLKQCNSNIILAFDGDKAGLEATYAIGQKLIDAHFKVSIWYNDSGLDPDELLRNQGNEALGRGIDDKSSWYDFLMSYAQGHYGIESFENRRRIIEFMLKHLQKADALEQDYYLGRLAKLTGFETEILKRQLSEVTSSPTRDYKPAQMRKRPLQSLKISTAEHDLLLQMLVSREAAYLYRDELGFFVSDVASNLALIILDAYRFNDELEVADLLSQDINPDLQVLLLGLSQETEIIAYDKQIIMDNIELIKRQLVNLNVNDMQQKMNQVDDIHQQSEMLNDALKALRNQRKE